MEPEKLLAMVEKYYRIKIIAEMAKVKSMSQAEAFEYLLEVAKGRLGALGKYNKAQKVKKKASKAAKIAASKVVKTKTPKATTETKAA